MINQARAIVRNLLGVKNTSLLHKVFPFYVNRLNKTRPIRLFLGFVNDGRQILLDENQDKEAFFNFLIKKDINYRNIPVVWWENFFYFIEDYLQDEEEQFVTITKSLPPDILSAEEWLKLYGICLIMGYFNVGYLIREKAKLASSKDSFHSIKSLLDNNHLIEVEETIEKANDISARNVNLTKDYISILTAKKDKFNQSSDKLTELLRGKDVALVGPVRGTDNTASEIDSAEIVVRLNYLETGKGCDNESLGMKTDLAYFNGVSCQIMKEKHNGQIPTDLKYAVFKTETYFPHLNPKNKLRTMTSYNSVLMIGSYNLIQYAILDILKHEPRSVKIYGTDLMLSPNRFKGYAVQKNLKDNALAFIPHEPIAQYTLLNSLRLNGVIGVDKRLGEVLDMGVADYMNGLQTIYAKALKINYK
jgi:hypothetical protein